ncbi:MAG: hypothetical protein WKF59_07285 [Chitinophagaceae bacterium]
MAVPSTAGTTSPVTITPTVTPSVSITSCNVLQMQEHHVTFTATPTNGGASPGYQWQVNGTAAGVQMHHQPLLLQH